MAKGKKRAVKKAGKKTAKQAARKGAASKQNQTVPTGASVAAFLGAEPDAQRRADCQALVRLMTRVTGEKPRMWGPGIVGFGSYHYRYESGREGDCPVAAFSPRKQALTLYLMLGFEGHADLMRKLGKHKTGKGCLYVKRLSDVDAHVLEELVRRSAADVVRRYG